MKRGSRCEGCNDCVETSRVRGLGYLCSLCIQVTDEIYNIITFEAQVATRKVREFINRLEREEVLR